MKVQRLGFTKLRLFQVKWNLTFYRDKQINSKIKLNYIFNVIRKKAKRKYDNISKCNLFENN